MDNSFDILSKINENFSHLSKGQKRLASFVIDHYESCVFMTASELAKAVGVSESTVVRFAANVGYSGFPEFMKALENYYKARVSSVSMIDAKYGHSSQSDVLNTVLRSDMEKLQDTLSNLDAEAFELAVNIILEAKKIYVVGLRSCEPLAQFLQFYLSMIRTDVILLKTTSTSELFEQMLHIDDRDCIIGISFPRYSMRTLKALEFANDKNAKVITLTDSVHSPLNLYSSCNLLARSDMVSIVDSLVAPLSVINALVVALCLKRPNEVRDNLENLEKAWNNYQVYLNDEINFINDQPILNYPLKKEDTDD